METENPAPRNVPYGLQNIAREAYYALLEKILEGLEMDLDRKDYPTVVITDYAKRRHLGGVTLSTGSVVVAKIVSDLPVGEPDELSNEFCPGGHRRRYEGLEIVLLKREYREKMEDFIAVVEAILGCKVHMR